MTKKEKVIKGILVCKKRMENGETFNCYGCPYRNPDQSHNCWMELFYDSLSVLNELGPVRPILMLEGRNKYNNHYVCPICDSELTYDQNFCSECGRQVQWE